MKLVIHQIQQQYPDNIITVTTDKGNEFLGDFKKFLDEDNVQIYYNDPNSVAAKTKMAIVERVHQTLWNYINKYTTYKNTLKFIDQIPNFVKNYNNKYHSTIQMKP